MERVVLEGKVRGTAKINVSRHKDRKWGEDVLSPLSSLTRIWVFSIAVDSEDDEFDEVLDDDRERMVYAALVKYN